MAGRTVPDFTRRLQANGRSVAILHFDTAAVKMLRTEQRQHAAYHIVRLMTGEPFAPAELEILGIMVEVEEDSDGGPEE